MSLLEKIALIQKQLREQAIDGWLLYDFHGSNRLAHEILEIPADVVLTRRFFYWIPQKGEPAIILHRIEEQSTPLLPGKKYLYLSWLELEEVLAKTLKKAKRVAMEYSPRNSNPYVSMVDAGTVEMVSSLGVEVVSSADLIQYFTSVLDPHQIETHLQAATVLMAAVDRAWDLIADQLRAGKKITEYDVQQFILSEFLAHDCLTEEGPICAVNEHSALPHYCAQKETAKSIQRGDFILIDLWCKNNRPQSIYADITRVGVASSTPTPRQEEVFQVIQGSMDAAIALITSRVERKQEVTGAEIDDVCRNYIKEKGYGDYFLHRSGHSIGIQVHGAGVQLDNLETSDHRHILPSTCFSLEPGIYLPNEFGIRIECDVLIRPDSRVLVTGGRQDTIRCLLS